MHLQRVRFFGQDYELNMQIRVDINNNLMGNILIGIMVLISIGVFENTQIISKLYRIYYEINRSCYKDLEEDDTVRNETWFLGYSYIGPYQWRI